MQAKPKQNAIIIMGFGLVKILDEMNSSSEFDWKIFFTQSKHMDKLNIT